MAVRTANFEIAAFDADRPAAKPDENLVEIALGSGHFSLWRRPTPGQWGMFTLRIGRSTSNSTTMAAMDGFLHRVMLTPEEIVADGRTDRDEIPYAEREEDGDIFVGPEFLWAAYEADRLGLISGEEVDLPHEMGVLEILKRAFEEHSGFPTEPASASPSRQPKRGPSSTAASRRASSTRSRSTSAAS